MEKENRIASALITIDKDSMDIPVVNSALHEFSPYIIARQGLSLPSKRFNIITIILESQLNTINSFAGKIGQIKGANIKVLIEKNI